MIYVKASSDTASAVKGFVEYYLENAPKLVKEVGYIPLQDDLYPVVLERHRNQVTGSIYESGEEVGTTLESLLKPGTTQK